MKLTLIRSPQLLFYEMRSKKEDKNMTTDTITMSNGVLQSRRPIDFSVHGGRFRLSRMYGELPVS